MGLSLVGVAQTVHHIDTLPPVVPQTHQYLDMHLPVGELYIKSSQVCGLSYTRLSAPDTTVRHHMVSQVDGNGFHRRHIELVSSQQAQMARMSQEGGSDLRVANVSPALDAFGDPEALRSELRIDPNLSTDLFLNLGVGASHLDFSGTSLRMVKIHGAFSDVMVSYRVPNQIPMQRMDLHVTKGDVMLKHIELARARMISLQNDMGDTKIILGDKILSHTTIMLGSGVGNCTLIVDRAHPVKLVVKGGLFSSQEISGSFDESGKGVYTNAAFRQHCNGNACSHATQIICNMDLGSVEVMEVQ